MSHFYDSAGNSCHEVMGKNGKLKPTTIREARELNLFPSVTTIMSVQDKPGLAIWKEQQLLQTAMEHPFHPDEWDEKVWRAAIIQRTRLRTEVAAIRGTEIHDKLEQYYTKGTICPKDEQYIVPAIKHIEEVFPGVKWIAEASFVDKNIGYAGRVDMYSKEGIVLDFKTKDKANINKAAVQYDDHRIQLAAYQEGLKLPKDSKRYNLFISTHQDSPGDNKLLLAEKFDYSFSMFKALHELWRLKNNYDPRNR